MEKEQRNKKAAVKDSREEAKKAQDSTATVLTPKKRGFIDKLKKKTDKTQRSWNS